MPGYGLKRQRSIDSVTHNSDAKRTCDAKHWEPSPRFWDTLPKIHLTRRALSELDRRTFTETQERQIGLSPSSGPVLRRSARLRPFTKPASLRCIEHRQADPCLQRLSRFGGPDLTALRGFPDPTMSDRKSGPSKRTTSSGRTPLSRRSSAYDANYESKLAQAGVFLTEQTDENDDIILPTNYDELTARLNKPRPSLSPSRFTEKDFRDFQKQARHARNESTTMQVVSTIEGQRNQFYSLSDSLFNHIEPFDPDLVITKPDRYDGASPKTIDHRVLRDLDKHIMPSKDLSRPAVPNFFLEGKSVMGRTDVAQRQAAHNGAVGARAMMSLQSYPTRAPLYDNKAYSFTSTYHDGVLRMYTTHATPPEPDNQDNRPQYHMTQLKVHAMTGDREAFIKGATHYRNARDLAKEQRESFIQQANQAARQMPPNKHSNRSTATTLSTTSTIHRSSYNEEHESSPDTDTSTDELALEKP